MAKIEFSESDKGVEASYDGGTIRLDFYPGDTRSVPVKVAAIRAALQVRHEEAARRRGRPEPEK